MAAGAPNSKEATQRFNLPCIFVSSDVGDAIQHRHVALGYISKPFSPATIADSLEAAQSILDGKVPERIPDGLELFH
jgi:two-component system, response regulator PdtaR